MNLPPFRFPSRASAGSMAFFDEKTTLPCVIADPDASTRCLVSTWLGEHFPAQGPPTETTGIKDSFQWLRNQPWRILLLNPQLADGCGFELLDRLGDTGHQVIFLAATEQFAAKAFRYRALDYLLKPLSATQLVAAVGRAERRLSSHLPQLPGKEAATNWQLQEKIALHSHEGLTLLPIAEIARLESDGGYTTFVLVNQQKIVVARAIGDYEAILPNHLFFRIHASHLVNLNFVRKVLREEGGCALMCDGFKVPIARRRKDEFLAFLRQVSSF